MRIRRRLDCVSIWDAAGFWFVDDFWEGEQWEIFKRTTGVRATEQPIVGISESDSMDARALRHLR